MEGQQDVLFWIWLAEAFGYANSSFRDLIYLYRSPYELFRMEPEELDQLDIPERLKERLSDKDLSHASSIEATCREKGIGILPYGHFEYPSTLREIHAPPVVLYYLGELPDFNNRLCVGMVGTRRMSAYGMQTAYKLSYELSAARVIVISGLATGIDGVCAAAALRGKGGTVAVLGCGVDVVYPPHHKKLYDAIVQDGVILSEYPPGTQPRGYHFPVRNRIISGIAQGTVVVEAGLGSGSLITAREAIMQGRDIFAVPANVGCRGSEGTNGLLRDGATLVMECDDILRPYEFLYRGSLDFSALRAARKESDADVDYLSDVGVIDLVSRGPSGDVRESEQKQTGTQQKKRKPKAEKKAEEQPPTDSEKAEEKNERPEQAKKQKRSKEESAPVQEPTPKACPTEKLDDNQRAVLEAMSEDRAYSMDELTCMDIMSVGLLNGTLTMLELLGYVQKLPGALYIKA